MKSDVISFKKRHWILSNLFLSLFFLIHFCDARSKLEKYQTLLCVDQQCKESISNGITTSIYPAPHKTFLTVQKDSNVKIIGKTGDKNFYYAEVNNKRGFIPAKFIRETHVHIEETKLNEVKFDFETLLPSKNPDLATSTNNDSVVLSSTDQLPDDTQSSSATPFVYTQKVTVIDGTTIDEDLLQINTPSPTFVSNAVTKTATVEANFTDAQLNKETVGHKENELGKEQDSPYNKLVKPIIASVGNVSTDSPVDEGKVIEKSETDVVVETGKLDVESDVEVESEENLNDDVVTVESDVSSESIESNENLASERSEQENVEPKDQPVEINSKDETVSESVSENKIIETVDSKKIDDTSSSTTNSQLVEPSVEEKKSSENHIDQTDIDKISPVADIAINSEQQNETEIVKNESETLKTSDKQATDNFESKDYPTTTIAYQASYVNADSLPKDLQKQQETTHHHYHHPDPHIIKNRIYNQAHKQPPVVKPPVIQPIVEKPPVIQPIVEKPPVIQPIIEKPPVIPPIIETPPVISPPVISPHVIPSDSPPQQLPNDPIPNITPSQQPKQVVQSNLNDGSMLNSGPIHTHVKNIHINPNLQNERHNVPLTNVLEAENNPQTSQLRAEESNNFKTFPSPSDPNHSNPSVTKAPLVDSVHQNLVNNNILKGKLAERVGFVSVIMEIIPDEVELFFESFNVSLHAIIFTSIVASFWCLMVVINHFIGSSRKERELRDISCKTQRQLHLTEAEKDKMEEQLSSLTSEMVCYKDKLNKIERLKHQLEQENQKMKNEISSLKEENTSLKLQAESNPQMSLELKSLTAELEEVNQENKKLNLKVNELEKQIDSYLVNIRKYEKAAKSDKETIDNLNEQLSSLNEEIEKLNLALQESEQKFSIVESDNTNLKELQNKLNEQIKEMKDDLLSAQEKAKNFQEECRVLEKNLETANRKISSLTEELEAKNTEIKSMRTLLNKLNLKNKQENSRQRRSTDVNGVIADGVNGTDGASSSAENSTNEDGNTDESMQDVIQLQLRLTQLEFEKEQLRKKLEETEKELNAMVNDIENIKKMNEQLKKDTETANHERMKAVMELEVLTKYYKEKELEYAKDIGVHRVKQEQQNEQSESLSSKLEVVQEENTILKDQLKSIRKELEETEKRFKSQLNQLEKQSHENWIAARNAERKYEEAKAEAAALRQTLSQSVKSPPPSDLSFGHLDDTASSVSSLPDMLNTSLTVPPPPPPPPLFPFLSMFSAPPIPQPPPAVSSLPVSGVYNSNESNINSNYWASSPVVTSTTVVPPTTAPATAIALPISNNINSSSTSLVQNDPTMTYSQANPTGTISQTSYPLPYGQSPAQQQASSHGHPYQYGHHPPHVDSFHGSQTDMTRNTYSPLSQRSTRTPLTNPPSISAYDMQDKVNQTNTSQYSQSNYGQSQNNPYSINPNYPVGQSQQQPQSHDVYGHHGQMYNNSGVGQQPHQQQPVINSNIYSGNNAYTVPHPQSHQYPQQQQQQQHPVPGTESNHSQSRPHSVHNQMV